nr:E109 [uncultured bacterium]ART38451.1 G405 [uncultured bacterium]
MNRCVSFLVCALLLTVSSALADHQHAPAPAATAPPPLFDDVGTLQHPITTANPQAQRYFDQGLRFIYAFNHDEATRAFKEAARLDPNCAMAYWGIALTLGPNYNLPVDAERDRAAYEALQKALSLAPQASEAERAYIEAVAKRHSSDPKADRKALDQTYADAMREVAKRYPDDLDAATLFAEALMNVRPWDLWTHEGQPQPGTDEIVSTLESVLQRNPDHPGAIHYYIHTVEASPQPERAAPFADRLGKLTPGAGHLVHMPSHIYIRVGRYHDAAESNAKAAAIDAAYIEKYNIQGAYRMMYYPHNVHFFWAAATLEGRSAEALQAARDFSAKLPVEMVRQMPMVEAFVPTYLFALVRFGKWQEILKQPAPPADLTYSTGMWHYARGLAFAAKKQGKKAAAEYDKLMTIAKATPPEARVMMNSSAALLNLAASVLAGELAAKQGKTTEAVQSLETAVRQQDDLRYEEPPPWYYPVRQSLGAVLLKANRAAEAEAVYREDLKRNPENGWSLYGLTQSLRAQKKQEEAAAVDQRFRKAWAQADIIAIFN